MMDIDKLRDLMGRVTPGPWFVDGPVWNQIVWTDSETRVCYIAHSNGLNDDRDIANAALIAMSPDLSAEVLRLTTERDAAVAANQALVTENARRGKWEEDAIDHLTWVLPLAKGYAHANPHEVNRRVVADADAFLANGGPNG